VLVFGRFRCRRGLHPRNAIFKLGKLLRIWRRHTKLLPKSAEEEIAASAGRVNSSSHVNPQSKLLFLNYFI
jgi:hypothetical protein